VYAAGAMARARSKDNRLESASVIPMRRTTESSVLWSETCALGKKIAGARPHQLDAGPSGYRPLRGEGFPAAGQAAG
jgi:hypothetical protein